MKLGFDYMGLVSIYADNVTTVQGEIAKIPQVIAVFDVTGESDCVAWIACQVPEVQIRLHRAGRGDR